MHILKRISIGFIATIALAACDIPEQAPAQPDQHLQQAAAAQDAANSIKFDSNAEIDNIKRRLELTSKPGLLGYVLLFNPGSGNPALYTTVKGKITSGGKRLNPTNDIQDCRGGEYGASCVVAAPGDEGTYGNSGDYIYFWDEDGRYWQWNGNYMYSDQPIRVPKNSLLINMVDDTNHTKK